MDKLCNSCRHNKSGCCNMVGCPLPKVVTNCGDYQSHLPSKTYFGYIISGEGSQESGEYVVTARFPIPQDVYREVCRFHIHYEALLIREPQGSLTSQGQLKALRADLAEKNKTLDRQLEVINALRTRCIDLEAALAAGDKRDRDMDAGLANAGKVLLEAMATAKNFLDELDRSKKP